MRIKLFVLSLFLFIISFSVSSQNNLSFFEEHIDFNLDSIYFSVNGIYSFCNVTKEQVKQKILFPFAVKTEMIDSVKVFNINNSTLIHCIKLENAIVFDLSVLPKDTANINIYFRQKSLKKNTYIITTTKYWENSLDIAFYSLITPKEMTIREFTYNPDSTFIIDDKRLYVWRNFCFLPQTDFTIVIGENK